MVSYEKYDRKIRNLINNNLMGFEKLSSELKYDIKMSL